MWPLVPHHLFKQESAQDSIFELRRRVKREKSVLCPYRLLILCAVSSISFPIFIHVLFITVQAHWKIQFHNILSMNSTWLLFLNFTYPMMASSFCILKFCYSCSKIFIWDPSDIVRHICLNQWFIMVHGVLYIEWITPKLSEAASEKDPKAKYFLK